MYLIVLSLILFIAGILCLVKCHSCKQLIRFNKNRFRYKRKGIITDYVRKRHSLAQSKKDKILYHPVVKFKKDGEIFEGVTETGYNREYYKVGNRLVVYYDILNPSRIKTKRERGDVTDVMVLMLLGILMLILSLVTLVIVL